MDPKHMEVQFRYKFEREKEQFVSNSMVFVSEVR